MTTIFYTDDQLMTLLAAKPHLFSEIVRQGTPLIAPDSTAMTFLFAAPKAAHKVQLWINRLTDKERTPLGTMKHVPGTNFWVRTVMVPYSVTASYCFRVDSDAQQPPGHNTYPHYRDLNARFGQLVIADEKGLSLLFGKDAQPSPWWYTSHSRSVLTPNRLASSQVEQCSIYLYLPPAPDRGLPLVILSDGDVWFPRLNLEHALDHVISSGYLPPCSVVGIGFKDSLHRREMLTNFDSWHAIVTESVIPWVQHETQTRGYETNGTYVLAGQSLGGLAALGVGLQHPKDFHALIAQSPSLWWHDSPEASPRDLSNQAIPWIVNEICCLPTKTHHPQTYLDVGIREGLSVAHMHGLSAAMSSVGWEHELGVVDGGHDYAWWRETFIRRLAQALP